MLTVLCADQLTSSQLIKMPRINIEPYRRPADVFMLHNSPSLNDTCSESLCSRVPTQQVVAFHPSHSLLLIKTL